MTRLRCVLPMSLVFVLLAGCGLTPTRQVRRLAEAASDPNRRHFVDANDIHVITLNQLLSNTTFTCAAHREIRTARPGRCPICASDLVAMPKGDILSQLGPEAVQK